MTHTTANPARVEGLARALAGAAHLNPRRQTPAWADLPEAQRAQFRAAARRVLGEEAQR